MVPLPALSRVDRRWTEHRTKVDTWESFMKLEPWERQPGESDPAWAAFLVYRDLPASARSIARVVSDTGKSRSLIAGWSSKWDWPARAKEYDRHKDRQTTLREIEALGSR
jgi:hypothetical protein